MRRFLILAVCAVLAAPPTCLARSGQSPSSGSLTGGAGGVDGACVGGKITLWYDLGGSGTSRNNISTITTGATAGRYTCSVFRAPCTAAGYTKMSFAIGTGLAAQVAEVGIFDVTAATRIASTGSQSVAAAGTISVTGLTAFTLIGGTQYLSCYATSAVATVTMLGMNFGDLINNAFVDTTKQGGATATEVAPFNAACTAGSTPYTCCTGLGTGTCLGMADRTGVPGIAAAATAGPLIVIGP